MDVSISDVQPRAKRQKKSSQNETKSGIVSTFEELGLKPELLSAIIAQGLTKPSFIQQRTIKPVLDGCDLVAQARTGNGKVYSFLISALQLVDSTLLQCQVIILTADEESALNILSIARQLSVNSGIMSVVGDCDSIARFEQNTDVVPAHITIIPKTQLAVAVSNTNSHKYFEHVRFLVIDGADGILDDTGFKPSCGGASNSDSNKTVDTSVQSAAVALSSQLTHPNLQTVVFTSLLTPNVTDLITNLKLREPMTWVLDETKKKNKNTDLIGTNAPSDAPDVSPVIPLSVVWKSPVPIDRTSHVDWFEARDWKAVTEFWSRMMKATDLPSFVTGARTSGSSSSSSSGETNGSNGGYGVTDLAVISNLGASEYRSSDPRFLRKTFALRIGYNGTCYSGFQQQKGVEGVLTVQDDLVVALGRISVAAGRTDKDVSAVSQVVCFTTYDDLTESDVLSAAKASEPCLAGRLAVYDCKRVPKRFHALFSATWRRYIYLFPLNRAADGGSGGHGSVNAKGRFDVGVGFVNECLSRLQGKSLSYNGFAFREARDSGEGKSDICELMVATAKVVDLNTGLAVAEDNSADDPTIIPALAIELVGDRFLRRMVRILSATAIRESVLDADQRDVDVLLKICHSGDRSRASYALSGLGLAFCGVGYDLSDLQTCRHNPSGIPTTTDDTSSAVMTSVEVADVVADKTVADKTVAKRDGKESKRAKRILHAQNKHLYVNINDERIQPTKSPETSATDVTATEVSVTAPSVAVDGPMTPPSSSDNHTIACIPVADSFWRPFAHELSNYDPELLFYPQRRFEFDSSGEEHHQHQQTVSGVDATSSTRTLGQQQLLSILVNQNCNSVGTTVWDAEVFLAHYINSLVKFDSSSQSIVLELGAGTAVAGILCSMKPNVQVIVQELGEDVLQHTVDCFGMNNVTPLAAIDGYWGADMVQRVLSATQTGKKVDYVIMADVLYHVEHFESLVQTVRGTLQPGSGQLILSFEQRRKDLAPIVAEFAKMFSSFVCRKYVVVRDVSSVGGEVKDDKVGADGDGNSSSSTRRSVEMSIYHFKGFTG